jgi:hypothetical protein
MRDHRNTDANPPRVVLAAPDTLHVSADMQLSDELHAKLEREKQAAGTWRWQVCTGDSRGGRNPPEVYQGELKMLHVLLRQQRY